MKNKLVQCSALLLSCALFLVACDKSEPNDSVAKPTSVPTVAVSFLESPYIYGQGNTSVYTDIPDVVGIVVDSVYGFEGGFGGKTGMDSLRILKTDVLGFGDTTNVGSSSYSFQAFNKGGYKVVLTANVVIAGLNNNPGPTDLEGIYKRNTAAGYLLEISKVGEGIYLLYNPGGAATIPPNPYLLYNYTSSAGTDSLAFANQTDLCNGGTQLVDPAAPPGLTSAEYTDQYPPKIISYMPITLSWVVYSFPNTSPSAANTEVCNWGAAVRVFIKQ